MECGADATLWEVAAISDLERVKAFFYAPATAPGENDLDKGLLYAGSGGFQDLAEFLAGHGADIHGGDDGLSPIGAALKNGHYELVTRLELFGGGIWE